MALVTFLTLGLTIALVYAGYPIAIWLVSRFAPRLPRGSFGPGAPWPCVCLVIPAHDEQAIIEAKLRNFLALDYPPDRLRAAVISDASMDETCARVRTLLAELPEAQRQRIRLIERTERSGKSRALSEEVPKLDADVLVFTDANAFFRPEAVAALVAPFADPRVALACGRLRYVPDDGFMSDEELYWRYEDVIKEAEGRAGRLLVANGSIYALRAPLFRPIPGAVADDFALPLLVAAERHLLVYVHGAIAEERLPAQGIENFRAKARIVTRGATALRLYWREVLRAGPLRTVQYLLHKVARWLMGLVLGALLLVSFAGASHPLLAAALTAQVAFYLLGIAAYLLARRGPVPGVLRMPFYFLLVNAAALAGLWDFARGQRRVTWEKSETTRRRPDEEMAVASAARAAPAGRAFSRRTALLVAVVLAVAAGLAAETAARLTYSARDAVRVWRGAVSGKSQFAPWEMPDPGGQPGLWKLRPGVSLTLADLVPITSGSRPPTLADRARALGIAESEVVLEINAAGYKGPPLRPDGRPRILAVGDSCTFGTLLDRSSYPRVLAAELDALGVPAEVVNAGVTGYSPEHVLARLDELAALHADTVLICLGWDALNSQRYTPTSWTDRLYSVRGLQAIWSRWLERGLDARARRAALADRPLRPDPNDPEIARFSSYEPPFMGDVARIGRELRAAGSRVFVVTLPSLYVSGERPTPEALALGVLPRFTDNPYALAALASRYNQRLREIVDGNDLELIDFASWTREGLRPRHRYFASPSALNEAGQRKMGEQVARHLREVR